MLAKNVVRFRNICLAVLMVFWGVTAVTTAIFEWPVSDPMIVGVVRTMFVLSIIVMGIATILMVGSLYGPFSGGIDE